MLIMYILTNFNYVVLHNINSTLALIQFGWVMHIYVNEL